MKLATFEKDGQHRIGAVLDGNIHLLDLAAAHQAATGASSPYLTDMLALIAPRRSGKQVTRGAGGGRAWPALLRKLDQLDPSYRS